MRVLLVGDYPPPHGGVAVHVQQLHDSLREHGVESVVLDIGKGGRPAPGVISVRTPAWYARRLAGFIREGWTVHVHTSGNNPKSWVLAATGALRGPGSARVITLHSGLLPDYLAASLSRRVFARLVLLGYSHVVAVSEAVRAALVRCGVPGEKILVYPAFCGSQVRPGAVTPAIQAARERRQVLLAMAHHPSPVYGRGLMFRALRQLADARPGVGLAVFGPGTHSEEFQRDAREHGVESLLENLGELAHPEALALIARCDAFIRPTTHDGDAISVREALALGVPCVASDVCARPEGATTFRAGSAEDLARRVLHALEAGPARVVSPDAGPVLMKLYGELTQSTSVGGELHAAQ
ncbi:glycosyltransferase family 4 protein [Cystobacter ferrugineus]|uniref:Glycosyl transferase family 1 n=1 Tax=Cystobacter ferrugineus TaxID=83449 RepID=A0A1L9B3P0_9BACT|nr:glycosyltransferase [Cystobacter ferrugineus]OJH36872.1 glycosyl transferase family 1 [Cystobacter ferrugineus]